MLVRFHTRQEQADSVFFILLFESENGLAVL